jgi:uncharacterized protein YhaN
MQANPVYKPQSSPTSYQPTPASYQASVPVTVYKELAAELQSAQAKLSFFQLQNEQLTRQNQMLLQEFEAIAQSTDRIQAILTQANLPEAKLSEVLAGIRASSQAATTPPRPNSQPQGRPPAQKQPPAKPPASPRKTAAQQTTNAIQEAISRARQLATEAAPNSNNEASGSDTLYYDSAFATFDAPAPVTKPLPKIEIREQAAARPVRKELRTEIRQETRQESGDEDVQESSGLSGWMLTLTIVAIILTSFGAGYLLMRPFVK